MFSDFYTSVNFLVYMGGDRTLMHIFDFLNDLKIATKKTIKKNCKIFTERRVFYK